MAVRVGISFTHKRSLMTVLQVYFCQTVAIQWNLKKLLEEYLLMLSLQCHSADVINLLIVLSFVDFATYIFE